MFRSWRLQTIMLEILGRLAAREVTGTLNVAVGNSSMQSAADVC